MERNSEHDKESVIATNIMADEGSNRFRATIRFLPQSLSQGGYTLGTMQLLPSFSSARQLGQSPRRAASASIGFFHCTRFKLAALLCVVPAFSGLKASLAAPAPIICIDPGHPSETSAGASANGLSENRLNWQVALTLQKRLKAMGIRTVMTKNRENQKVTNRQRAEIANRASAALFIRLHCDEGGGRGFAWYYPDRAGHKQGVTGPPRHVQVASREAAYILNETMTTVLRGSLRANPVKTDAATFVGGRQGGVLTGSIFSKVPTALLEMCFINQRNDARFIASKAGQEKMAQAIALGVQRFLRSRP
ncbi:MAG: N-acetylmuramoyl-L-alanine amidase [Abditibacteriota bacterium]|nr:N-acetylmuramoyl-L-alanine amidase [Abditibacteriota bacterium]